MQPEDDSTVWTTGVSATNKIVYNGAIGTLNPKKIPFTIKLLNYQEQN